MTTRSEKTAAPAPDLLERDFGAAEPNQKWIADITYVPTWAGFLYLAVVLDCFSRRVVGWCMRDDLATQLVLDALEMAIHNRRPGKGVIHHSDRGCLGGLKWSSQHLDEEVARWPTGDDRSGCVRIEGRSLHRDDRRSRGVRTGSGSGTASLAA